MIIRCIMILIIFALFHLTAIDAHQYTGGEIKYLSPVPQSNYNSVETNIIIKFNESVSFPERLKPENIIIEGSRSGIHDGRVVLTGNNKTILFYPSLPFENNELVNVELNNLSRLFSDRSIPDIKYTFSTTRIVRKEREINSLQKLFPYRAANNKIFSLPEQNSIAKQHTLPSDFPLITMEANNAAPGVVSFAPFAASNGNIIPTYMIILDNSGLPLFYRKASHGILDFKMQDNGLLTYFDMGTGQYYIMDDHLKIIDSVSMKNGYPTDLHELIITNENHYLLMSYDVQKVRMDTIVTGGNPDADVTGLIIQELDENKDVVFQWRSWDYYKITDATPNIDLTAAQIDYVHGNAIELDNDGNFMISNRHMDEVTKINRGTGEIIWRWGGRYCENNQFTFVNDSIGFSHQHDIRRLPNGNVILFDNGNLHTPSFSRVVEYNLDEQTKIASLVWEYRNEPWTYSFAMGNSRRLENGNTFIGWGWNSGPPSISEVTPDGRKTFYLSLPDTLFNYRAFKFIWSTGLFTSDVDTVYFNKVTPGDSIESAFNLTNNSTDTIEINETYISNFAFQIKDALPVTLAPAETKQIALVFKPMVGGNYSDKLYLRFRKENEMIAQVVNLSGTADTTATSVKDPSPELTYSLEQNYPNPFNPVTVINYSVAEEAFVKLKIYNILGREVAVLKNEIQKPGKYFVEFNAEQLSSGVYYYTIDSGSFTSTRKMILLK